MDTNIRRIFFAVLVAFILCIGITGSARAFNTAQYKAVYLDPLVTAYAKKFPSGMRVLPPKKLRIRARLTSMPYKCNTNYLKVVFKMMGLSDKISVSNCIDIKSQKGTAYTIFVQDVLVPDFNKSTKIGEVVEFYVVYLYFDGNKRKPGFLVSAFIELDH